MALKTQNWRKKGGRMKITIETLADGFDDITQIQILHLI
jgi:hypothetical protein